MPWKESCPMDERVKFISRRLQGDKMTDLCREFGISRKTGYKFWDRYLKHGLNGLNDASKSPLFCPHKTDSEIENLVLELRKAKPTWGPKKLKARLDELHIGLSIPAASTIGAILERHNLVTPRTKTRKRVYYPTQNVESKTANELWCVDFKGQFRLGNRKYCYPLTTTDHYSRFLLACEALETTNVEQSMLAFERVFQEYGLPERIRSDNGVPFAARGILGLTRLAVWWMRLGIEIERIEPGHPEQNGRHERMHLTLKQETTRPASPNFLAQQERFDSFREEFNTERPHEALGMLTPKSRYEVSNREYPGILKPLSYPLHEKECKVYSDGNIRFNGTRIYLSSALAEEIVGLREVEPGIWLVTFIDIDLGYLNIKERKYLEYLPTNKK